MIHRVHRADIEECVRDIEFCWAERDGQKVLMYRICKGLGFRGWKNWEEVKEMKRDSIDPLPKEYRKVDAS